MTDQQPLYHHYLPAFYQARWCGKDGRLRRFSKPYQDKFVAKWVSPEVSGGEDYLYSDKTAPTASEHAMESRFMSPLDSLASQALSALEASDPAMRHDPRLRSAWSRFLISLMMRMPDHLETLTQGLIEEWARTMPEIGIAYEAQKGPTDPATLGEYLDTLPPDEVRGWMLGVLRILINRARVGEWINNMRWFIRTIEGPSEFLTSDRPIISQYDVGTEGSYILLPIGPKRVFIAVNSLATQRQFENYDPEEWVQALNRMIAGAAVKFVFAKDDNKFAFVKEQFGIEPRETLFDKLVRYRQQKNANPDAL